MSKIFKKLTFVLLCFALSREIFAETTVINQEKFKTHLRWNIFANKDDVYISKKGASVFIKTLNVDLFESFKKDLSQIAVEKNYVKEVSVSGNDKKTSEDSASTIELKLVNEAIELFSFYRDREKKYVVDFWSDTDSLNEKKNQDVSSLDESGVDSKKDVEKADKKDQKIPPFTPKKPLSPVVSSPKKVENPSELTLVSSRPAPEMKAPVLEKKEEAKVSFSRNKDLRDFRYGASFIYNYVPLSPLPQTLIDLENKTAEEFYPIHNREYEKDNKEAHLQLTINFYRQKKWGFMSKSIKLFEQKYGEGDYRDLHEYLKANALLRENIVKKDEAPIKMAVGIYKGIADRTKDYDLAKGLNKFLLQYYISEKQYIDGLQIAKRLYVMTKEKFDMEEARDAAEYILYSLAQLNQVDKIRELSQDKSLVKLLNNQLRIAYEFYALSSLGQDAELIKSYESLKKSLTHPVEPSILFNVAESYFRVAQYDKALDIFDDFITKNSHMTGASFARVRIALIYDLLDKDYKELIKLYKTAIDRSQNEEASLEAKIRYVALRSVRPFEPTNEDREIRIFLEKQDLTKSITNEELVKLLWLVRFRTFIVDKDYVKALSYLAALPLDKMNPTDLKVFEADGAEVVYGMILQDFRNSDYSHLIKLWEVYKDRFLTKVAVDPYMNFVVGYAYLKLGLTKGFDRLVENFEKLKETPRRTFPDWNQVTPPTNSLSLLSELKVIKNINERDWARAGQALNEYAKTSSTNNKIHYYRGIIAYAQKNYQTTSSELETYLGNQTEKEIYDSYEVAEMLRAYTDSLYEMNQMDKFSKVSSAIMHDVGDYGSKNPYMNKVKERIAYLAIEIMAGKNSSENFFEIEKDVRDFEKKYRDSKYLGRLKYLLGVAFVSNRKVEEGKQIFKGLLEDKTTEDYIKELVRTELATIKIKEKTI